MAEVSLVILPSCDCHRTSLMLSQLWFRSWLGAARQQAITCANVDPDLYRHIASLGHNELMLVGPVRRNHTWNQKIFIHKNTMKNVICTMSVILFRPHCVNFHTSIHNIKCPSNQNSQQNDGLMRIYCYCPILLSPLWPYSPYITPVFHYMEMILSCSV